MPLRPSQVETLRAVDWRASAYELAYRCNCRVETARDWLAELSASGHLYRQGDFFYLTQLGREALEGSK